MFVRMTFMKKLRHIRPLHDGRRYGKKIVIFFYDNLKFSVNCILTLLYKPTRYFSVCFWMIRSGFLGVDSIDVPSVRRRFCEHFILAGI